MWKPYATSLTSAEIDQVYRALETGLRSVKREGDSVLAERIQDALDMIDNHERIGGWETKVELDSATHNSFLLQCEKYGRD